MISTSLAKFEGPESTKKLITLVLVRGPGVGSVHYATTRRDLNDFLTDNDREEREPWLLILGDYNTRAQTEFHGPLSQKNITLGDLFDRVIERRGHTHYLNQTGGIIYVSFRNKDPDPKYQPDLAIIKL